MTPRSVMVHYRSQAGVAAVGLSPSSWSVSWSLRTICCSACFLPLIRLGHTWIRSRGYGGGGVLGDVDNSQTPDDDRDRRDEVDNE